MALTREFRETIAERMRKDPVFRRGALSDSVNELLLGEVEAGKAMLRDYINATIGFAVLSVATDIPDKSLQRMFGPRGNPTANNLFRVIEALQRHEKVSLEVRAKRRAA